MGLPGRRGRLDDTARVTRPDARLELPIGANRGMHQPVLQAKTSHLGGAAAATRPREGPLRDVIRRARAPRIPSGSKARIRSKPAMPAQLGRAARQSPPRVDRAIRMRTL